MDYQSETEVEIGIEVERRTDEDEVQEIIHSALVDAFSQNFTEFEWDFSVRKDYCTIQMEISDESHYRSGSQYEVSRNLIDAIYDAGLQPVKITHETQSYPVDTGDEGEC